MAGRTTPVKQVPSVKTHIIIAVAGLIVCFISIYYYFQYLHGNVSGRADERVFYLILILFGVSVSAIVFGVMQSYAVLNGERLDTKFKFTGPIVGVILTVIGGFYLPHQSNERTLTFRIFDEDQRPVTGGLVKLYIPNVPQQNINDDGEARFINVPAEHLQGDIRISISSPGYSPLTVDTSLQADKPVQFVLSKVSAIKISGRVEDARSYPISDAEVSVDGTAFAAKSLTNGSYTLTVRHFYAVGDEIVLSTSHGGYEDKHVKLIIQGPDMRNVDIVLNPVNGLNPSP